MLQQLSSNQTRLASIVFWLLLVNEIKGCNYSRLEICQDTLLLGYVSHFSKLTNIMQ